MKNWLKILVITTILINSFTYGFEASAQISVYNIRIETIKDGQATLKWRTNETVKSEIHYGLNAQNLDKKWSNNLYKTAHEASLYGLEEDKNYFYQITLYSPIGEKLELYTRSFSTDNMEDARAPNFINVSIVQTIGNVVVLAWQADEKVSTEIHYWKKNSNSNDATVKQLRFYKEYNEYFLYNLDTYSQYYIKVIIKDKANNKDTKTFSVNIYNKFNNDLKLEIKNIEPLNSNTDLITTNQATIKFQSNLAGQAYIQYGIAPNKLKKKIYINDNKLTTDYQVTIKDLEPNTTYYYNIYVGGAVYKKQATVAGLSFITKPSVLGVKEVATNLDSDHDQLTNSFEMAIGTNPSDPDSDNDGYRDNVEVKNGYNPLGLGKWAKKIDFFYGQPQLDLNYEQTKALELKKIIDEKIKYIYISPSKWNMLVNAYVYGDYPINAIIMYVKLNGYTVHPDIPWSTWKDSPDYLKYAKYIK